MNHHWLYMTTKLIVVNDNQRCFLQLQFWRSPTLPSTVRQGPLFTLIQHSLHLKEPKTLSLIPGGFQTPAPSVGHLCAGRDLAIHSLQDTLLLMAFTETKLTRVAYQKFLLLQCHTRMPRRYCVEWKVMNFRQLISKDRKNTQNARSCYQWSRQKKSMSPPRQYSIPFAWVQFWHHNFYIVFFWIFTHFCSLATNIFFWKRYNLIAIRPFDSHPAIRRS